MSREWETIGTFDEYKKADKERKRLEKKKRNYSFKIRARRNGSYHLKKTFKKGIGK